jgi:hypothetical protein
MEEACMERVERAIPRGDVLVVRELARRVAEIAALPVQQETIAAWHGLNGLRPVRPMVMIDEFPWNEMDVEGELALRTADPFCQGLETVLRQTLYAWDHMRADMVVEPFVDVPKVIQGDGNGVGISERTLETDPHNIIVSHEYADQLATEEDVQKIRAPRITLDEAATRAAETKAHELLDGILGVRMQGWIPNFEIWDDIVTLRGAETVLLDMIDRPDHMHAIADRLTDARLAVLDQLEAQGLLGYGAARVACTGAHTDQLPAKGFDPARPRAIDNWTSGMAQILLSVSNRMFEEFEIDNAIRWYSRFGLAYYGCCDPLHDRVDIIRRIPNVRKISMSPWADVERGAERIGRDFVFSHKPNPALAATDTWDLEAAEREVARALDAARRHDCPIEVTFKDLSTVRNQPQRLWQWSEMASRLARA